MHLARYLQSNIYPVIAEKNRPLFLMHKHSGRVVLVTMTCSLTMLHRATQLEPMLKHVVHCLLSQSRLHCGVNGLRMGMDPETAWRVLHGCNSSQSNDNFDAMVHASPEGTFRGCESFSTIGNATKVHNKTDRNGYDAMTAKADAHYAEKAKTDPRGAKRLLQGRTSSKKLYHM
jgi:hypothetical protein